MKREARMDIKVSRRVPRPAFCGIRYCLEHQIKCLTNSAPSRDVICTETRHLVAEGLGRHAFCELSFHPHA